MKRARIKPISNKRKEQLCAEKELTQKLYLIQKGMCTDCGGKLGWRSAKHEIKSRAQGGDPLDRNNCILLCGKCHSTRHHLKEV